VNVRKLDSTDPLAPLRKFFHLLKNEDGKELVYLCGNSLGLQPKRVATIVNQELANWATKGVEGHFIGGRPWVDYHALFSKSLARIVGAEETEVVAMNSLTSNLHFLLQSFYEPKELRTKILAEKNLFPSDYHALVSLLRNKGMTEENLILVEESEVEAKIIEYKEELAIVLVGGVNYLTGTALPMKSIAAVCRENGIALGLDLAHAVGNVPLSLHDWDVDFAVWCSYKYLNGGPGCVGGAFVHQKHHGKKEGRLEGWWGTKSENRFQMEQRFDDPMTAEAWQVSNAPIMNMVGLLASLEIYDEVDLSLRIEKQQKFNALLDQELRGYEGIEVITPIESNSRGSQLSILIKGSGERLAKDLRDRGFIVDIRNNQGDQIIRIAPSPLYNTFTEVVLFCEVLKELI
jgi:kynureninase